MTELEPLERLRVLAAMGGDVTVGAEDLRNILVAINRAEKFHLDGVEAYRKANRMHLRSMIETVSIGVGLITLMWVFK